MNGKGKGYERWAKSFNLRQTAEVLIFLQERGVHSMEDLNRMTSEAADSFNDLCAGIRKDEEQLKKLGETKKHIVNYSKTKAIYSKYRKGGRKDSFYETHRADIEIHLAAKRFFDSLGPEKIPTVREINEKYQNILGHKKAL